MARVCDSCNVRFDPAESAEVNGEIPRFGISGGGFKVTFEVVFYSRSNDSDPLKFGLDDPDICPRCIILNVKDSIDKWPPR